MVKQVKWKYVYYTLSPAVNLAKAYRLVCWGVKANLATSYTQGLLWRNKLSRRRMCNSMILG